MPSDRATKRQRYAILTAAALILGAIILFILIRPAPTKPPSNGVQPRRNDSYQIAETQVICDLSLPPMCSGSIWLSDEEPTRLEAKIDRDTKVRYQGKEIQIYPSDLKEGMVGQVTFKPSSTTIETMVITD